MSDDSAISNKMGTLFSELRRRRVLRSSAIYVAVAWLLIQVADTTFPIFAVDDAYTRYVTLGLMAGFPVAVVISWIFDIDPGSIIRTPELERNSISTNNYTDSDSRADYTLSVTETAPRSIAVMPFSNVNKDPDNEFFSDGIAEELLNLLSRVHDLKVAARTSSFAFRDTNEDIRIIASRLGVRHVLEGSVRRAGDRVRITAQLVDAQSGYQLWSSSFDRDLGDIFAVQDEIAASIVDALRATLDASEKEPEAFRTEVPTDSIEAYQLYLRGMYLWQRRGAEAMQGAIGALTQAVEIDPDYAEAIALLASAQAAIHEYNGEDRETGFAIAQPLARRAMQLDESMGRPHAVLGYIGCRRWDWASADASLRKGLELEPHEPIVHLWYSNLLNDLGYQDRALSHALTAYQYDRLSPQANNVLALNFVLLGRDDAARKHVAVAREFGLGGQVPDFVDYFVHLRRGEHDAAITVLSASLKRTQRDASWVRPTVEAIAHRGQEDAQTLMDVAMHKLTEAQDHQTISVGMAQMQYILLNQAQAAFDLADTQLKDHSLTHLWFFLPEAKALRDDKRFTKLMKKMGIEKFWHTQGRPPLVDPSI